MSSQGSNAISLSQFGTNAVHDSYKDYIRILQEDAALVKKLECIKILASEYFPTISQSDLESELLHYLMPCVNAALVLIFKEATELVRNKSQQKCLQTLAALKEYLQMAISLLQILDDILQFLIGKPRIDLSDIQSLPLYLCKVLHSTFLHCKASNNLYSVYLDSLNEILLLFKKGQDVHSKLLRLLDVHIVVNFLFEDELVLLNQVLETLVDIGAALTGMNMKSMADNWKGYAALIQKYADALSADFNLQHPLNFFTTEIVKNARTVLHMDADVQAVTPTLKITNFLIKVMLKLCHLFWTKLKHSYNEIWDFLISFYSFSYSQLQFKNYSKDVVVSIKLHLFDSLEPFLSRLSIEKEFFQASSIKSRVIDDEDVFGFLIVYNTLLQKILVDKSTPLLKNLDFSCHLELLFHTVSKSYTELIRDDTVYGDIVATVATVALIDELQYHNIETVLYKNLLSENLWSSIISSDVLCLVLSKRSPSQRFETLCNVTEQCEDVLKLNFTHRSEFSVLSSFIRQLYQMQEKDSKLQFMLKYPIETHVHIWKHIGFKCTTSDCNMKTMNLLTNLMDRMEKYDAGKCGLDDFIFMCYCMDAVSTIAFEELFLDVGKLSSLTVKLWDFDASDCVLSGNNWFRLYLHSLCNLTNSLIWKWNNTQLAQILQQMKALITNGPSIKLSVLQFLGCVSNKFIENTQEHPTIISHVSELFNTLLNDSNPVITQYTLEIFTNFIHNTSHDEIVHNSLNNSKNLQEMVSDFVQRRLAEDAGATERCLKIMKGRKSQHKCSEGSNTLPKPKKLKTENGEVCFVLQRIKKDVNYFSKLCDKENLSEENISDIRCVLKQLQIFL